VAFIPYTKFVKQILGEKICSQNIVVQEKYGWYECCLCKLVGNKTVLATVNLRHIFELEIIVTLLRQIGIPPPTVAPWQEALYKDRQSNRRVGVF